MEDKVPKTYKIVWENLPLNGKIGDGLYFGKLMYLIVDTGFDELENARSMGFLPGDIAYQTRFHGRDTHNEILIVYGDAIVRDVCGWTPAYYFARIVEGNLEHLRNVATRIRECGTERITTKKQSVSRK